LSFLLAFLCVSLTGCGTISRVERLGTGYEVVAYTRHSFSEPEATQITLQYRKGWHTVVIWPSLDGVREVKHNDVVVFVGEAAFKQLDPGKPHATDSRLFAVKAPEPPLDITDEILWRWSKESGEDFAAIMKKASIVYPQEKDNGIEFPFARGGPDLNIFMSWDQISNVMREVKKKGVVRKDRVWDTSYIEKEFKPEVQK
jgi:hypothetical protein